MSGMLTQLTVLDQVSYGTAIAATRGFEIVKESIAGEYDRIESASLRAATRIQRSDRFAINPKGAAGTISLEAMTKNLGFWLKYMLGTVADGGLVDTTHTYTGTVGDLTGKAFTCQVQRAATGGAGALTPFTYEDGKVTSWTISNAVDGVLLLDLDVDFSKETVGAGAGAYAAQTTTYPSGLELLTFIGGSVSIAGTQIPVSDCEVKCDMGLNTGRYYINTATKKKEQLEDKMRAITWDATVDFTDLTQINRASSATASGALAALILKWVGPTLAGSTTFPSLTVTLPAGRFDDDGGPTTDGPSLLTQKLSGVGLADPTNGAISVAYTTADTVA